MRARIIRSIPARHGPTQNPHAHVVFKDADIHTGGKVIGTTTSLKDVREAQEHGWKVPPRATTQDLRNRWCDHLNKVMERAGLDIRYDARSLKEQGIDREPQIPIGPKAQALEEKGYAFDSHDQTRGDRTIAYSLLDQASRVQYNDRIIETNREKERADAGKARKPSTPRSRQHEEWRDLLKAQAATRKAVYEEQKRDREALRVAQEAARLDHKTWAKQLYASGRQAAYDEIKKEFAGKWKNLRTTTPLSERKDAVAALKAEQMKAYAAAAKRQADLRRPGLYQYDQLRSLRTAQKTDAAETRLLPATPSTPHPVAPSSNLAGELAATKGYYASRIAAARLTMSSLELATAIRSIQDEQTLAARAIIQRWEGYFQDREQKPADMPKRPSGDQPLLRYPGLRKG